MMNKIKKWWKEYKEHIIIFSPFLILIILMLIQIITHEQRKQDTITFFIFFLMYASILYMYTIRSRSPKLRMQQKLHRIRKHYKPRKVLPETLTINLIIFFLLLSFIGHIKTIFPNLEIKLNIVGLEFLHVYIISLILLIIYWKKYREFIFSLIILVAPIYIQVCVPEIMTNLKEKLRLEFFHILAVLGALVTFYWTHKRYQQTQEQLQQNEQHRTQNTLDNLRIEIIKAMNKYEYDPETKTDNDKGLIYQYLRSISTIIDKFPEKNQGKLLADYLDFKGVKLSGIHLNNLYLPFINLERANLQGAKLLGAKLLGANLQHANLQGVNLQNANLQDAKLQDARLQDAYLTNAYVSPESKPDIDQYKDSIIGYEDINWV